MIISDIIKPRKFHVKIDESREVNISKFSKDVFKDRYLLEGESTAQELYARVAEYYAEDQEHAQRLYDWMSLGYFSPPTPVLANGGTRRGYPVSCFINEVDDSLKGILDIMHENGYLAAGGGGIGTYWSNVRSIGEKIHGRGETAGVIPFLKMSDSYVAAISQGSLRRGSTAVYLLISHPEIREFIDARKFTGGDIHRKFLHLFHGVVITDSFMKAVELGDDWDLISPATGRVVKTVSARELWAQILVSRIETGVPYIVYIDTVNRHIPEIYKKLGLTVQLSNLCTEIMLTTGLDYNNKARTAVCVLSSLNLLHYDIWKYNDQFIYDIMLFLDNVVQDFIESAKHSKWHENSIYSAEQERSVSLGVMGWHDLLQKKMIPMESDEASRLNIEIFSHMKSKADDASKEIAKKKGACPDAKKVGRDERFVHKIGIAPTATISILTGNSSPCIEPRIGNCIAHKTLTGTHYWQNPFLEKLLESKGQNKPENWISIVSNNGSVDKLPFLSQDEKDVFKTAFEIDQEKIVVHAADRQKYICQSQSLNLFFYPNSSKLKVDSVHKLAWKLGVKSLYYVRSMSLQNVTVSKTEMENDQHNKIKQLEINVGKCDLRTGNNDDCESCQ